MYHHHNQQQGHPRFSNGPRPALHQPPQNQHPNSCHMQPRGFQFPRPTQLPDELESALAIRSARDIDLRQIDHMTQHQHQVSGPDTSQHGNYGSNLLSHSSDHLPGHQQNQHWSEYQTQDKTLVGLPLNVNVHSKQHLGLHEQSNSNQAGVHAASRIAPARTSNVSLPSCLRIGKEGLNFYTPESAGSILASFGLSNEDLEVLSHYPDDQLTPDTLPFILRDIQINKSGNQNPGGSGLSTFLHGIQDLPGPSSTFSALSQSSEVPSLLTVTQTPGKVIDYGHASRAKEEPTGNTGKSFKREQLSGEKTVKTYPVSSTAKDKKPEANQICLDPPQPRKIEDKDYRRINIDKHKNIQPPGKDFPLPQKSQKPARDYKPLSESRYKTSLKRSLPSSSGSKLRSERKKIPTPTMIGDFTALLPKVYPHTCSLCNILCEHEKDWQEHVNTVVHTAGRKDLFNKYPDWNPNASCRKGHYRSLTSWDSKDCSPSHPSRSRSPASSPPRSKYRVDSHSSKNHSRAYAPQSHRSTVHRHRSEQHHSSSHSPKPLRRTSDAGERRPSSSDSSGPPHYGVKRLHDERRVSSSSSAHVLKPRQPYSYSKHPKAATKPGAKTTTVATKSPPAKKKKPVTPATKDTPVVDCLVYLTGIPVDASEQEVTNLVGSFGKINNVILMPCCEEDNGNDNGQNASVCMMKVEDARALAAATDLCIREQHITAAVAKKPEAAADADGSLPATGNDKMTPKNISGGECEQKAAAEKGTMLITGLPESGWSESDVIAVVQPFWIPSDIILATQIGKVLVPVPEKEAAQEMLKVLNFVPAKVKDSQIKPLFLKQCIDRSTPVALFNVLMGSAEPQSTAAVTWNSLLVIRNVPDLPSGYREVQKLIQRFGTVIKSLVLKNMVICEMATAAMALSVYKRFQTFPCIMQSNPLFFSRKADPKTNAQGKVISTCAESFPKKTTKVKSSQIAIKGKPESQSKELGSGQSKNKKMKVSQKKVQGDAAKEKPTKDVKKVKKSPRSSVLQLSDISDGSEDLDAEAVIKAKAEDGAATAEEKQETSTIQGTETLNVAGEGSTQKPIPEQPPTVTQEMTNPPVVESASKKPIHSNGNDAALSAAAASASAAPASAAPASASAQAKAQGEVQLDKKPSTNKETGAASQTHSEAKRHDNERHDNHGRKEKEAKDRERRERERRAREREERFRKDTERNAKYTRESERRETERREKERRQRKRGSNDGSGNANRSDDSRQSSKRNKTDLTKNQEDEEDFLFNLSDFVTVDEVGEVTDLPGSPSTAVTMETTVGDEDASTLIQQTSQGDTNVGTTTSPVQLEPQGPDADHAKTVTSQTSDALVSSEPVNTQRSAQAESQIQTNISQTVVATCEPVTEKSKPKGETEKSKLTGEPETVKSEPTHEPQTEKSKPTDEPETEDTEPTCEPETENSEPTGKPETEISEPTCEPEKVKSETTCELETEKTESTSQPDSVQATGLVSTAQVQALPKPPISNGNPFNCSAASKETAKIKEEHKDTNPLETCQVKEEEEERKPAQQKSLDEPTKNLKDPNAEAGKPKMSEGPNSQEEVCVKTEVQGTDLPPYDPRNAVGMEYLIPKTGFFCKACSRFFSGAKEAELNHCRTIKHYENLQEFLKNTKTGNVKSKTDSS